MTGQIVEATYHDGSGEMKHAVAGDGQVVSIVSVGECIAVLLADGTSSLIPCGSVVSVHVVADADPELLTTIRCP